MEPDLDDSLQFVKEQKTDGAVHNIYLKKVRYHTPSNDVELDNSSTSLLQWRMERLEVIRFGTLKCLIEAVSMEKGDIDSSYVSVFLSTFRSFASVSDVTHTVISRYREVSEAETMKQEVRETHKKTFRTFICIWLDNYPEDFREPPIYPCLREIISFAKRDDCGQDIHQRAKQKLDQFIKDEDVDDDDSSIDLDDISCKLDEASVEASPEESPESLPWPVNFEDIPVDVFAEQLTYVDADLFRKVVPHHCLGSVWSRRDKKGFSAPSVFATVDHFNAVSFRVIATVLKNPLLPPDQRAKFIEKWIYIAQELRLVKNFSSLKAILSGLQSNSIYRLQQVWDYVEEPALDLFEELSEIFSENNNQILIRELLIKEGTAKYADLENSTGTVRGHKRRSSIFATLTRKSKPVIDPYLKAQGTVPYLGTFLTDLTMIDTAIPDKSDDGLISFDKKRKEFEILAQIRLLQQAARLYVLKPDPAFFQWFHSIRVYDDNESYELSCEIEPTTPSTLDPTPVKGHHKKSSLGFFTPRRASMDVGSIFYTSTPTTDDATSVHSMPDATPSSHTPLRHSVSTCSLRSIESQASSSPWRSPDACVMRVVMEISESHCTNHYKSVVLGNSDHTKGVVHNILSKFGMEGKPEDFVLFQILPDGELQLPDKGNIFYAINRSLPELHFVVRKKSDIERLKGKHSKCKQRKHKLTL